MDAVKWGKKTLINMRAERWGRNVGRSWKWMRTQIWWSLEILDCGTRSSYFEFKRAPAFGSTLFYTYSLQWEWMNERTNEWNEWMSSLTCFSFLFFFNLKFYENPTSYNDKMVFALLILQLSFYYFLSLHSPRQTHSYSRERRKKRVWVESWERERARGVW